MDEDDKFAYIMFGVILIFVLIFFGMWYAIENCNSPFCIF